MGLWVDERRGGTGKVRVVHGARTPTPDEDPLRPEGSTSRLPPAATRCWSPRRRAAEGGCERDAVVEAVMIEARRGTPDDVRAGEGGGGCV